MNAVSLLATICLLLAKNNGAYGAITLEKYNVDPLSVTVSGASSGAAMAMQLHVAFSNDIHGAAILSGPPYGCAKGGLIEASYCMFMPALNQTKQASTKLFGLSSLFRPQANTQGDKLADEIRRLEGAEKIDPSANLAGDKVFVMRGTLDPVVTLSTIRRVVNLYSEFGADVHSELEMAATHGFPTDFYGARCGMLSPLTDFINNCDYNGAYHSLNSLYGGTLAPPDPTLNIEELEAQVQEYNQREFGASGLISMDTEGYIFVPSGCRDKTNKCKLHVALHGCLQSKTNSRAIYAKKTGYLPVAETNNIIMLYPQAAPSLLPVNPMACWDWWGYAGLNFLTKEGKQMKTVHKMIQRVVGVPEKSQPA